MTSKPVKSVHSDSEDDDDYVPLLGEQLSSDSEDHSPANQQEDNKALPTAEELKGQQKGRDALWESFQTSVASSSKRGSESVEEKKIVKIQKRYLFAGEYITEIVDIPEDSPDATKWPVYQPENSGISNTHSKSPTPSATISDSVTPSSSIPTSPPPKKPGPRKPKKTLAALPSASTQKAKKLTTLDKSLMDWKAHTGDSTLQDELEANRKAGGYLEKVEFLQRVEDRKEEQLESLQSRKRRKL